jgi:hypothetical protein
MKPNDNGDVPFWRKSRDDDELKREIERYEFVLEDAKRYFGEWDMCDPVSWAILRVVQAQNDLADAIDQCANGLPPAERMRKDAIAERRAAIDALLQVFKQNPRPLDPNEEEDKS